MFPPCGASPEPLVQLRSDGSGPSAALHRIAALAENPVRFLVERKCTLGPQVGSCVREMSNKILGKGDWKGRRATSAAILGLNRSSASGRKPVKALAARPEDISLHQTLLGIFFSPVLRYLVITWPQTGGVCRSGFESPHRPATPQTLPAHRQAPHRQSGSPCSIKTHVTQSSTGCRTRFAPRREAFRFAAFICALSMVAPAF